MKIGKPTHLKIKNGATSCGLVGVEYSAYDPRDVDCIKCLATQEYKRKMYGDKMKSGRGGKRVPGPGKKLGRPATGKKERISINITKDNLAWLKSQPESYSHIVNYLLENHRELCTAGRE